MVEKNLNIFLKCQKINKKTKERKITVEKSQEADKQQN